MATAEGVIERGPNPAPLARNLTVLRRRSRSLSRSRRGSRRTSPPSGATRSLGSPPGWPPPTAGSWGRGWTPPAGCARRGSLGRGRGAGDRPRRPWPSSAGSSVTRSAGTARRWWRPSGALPARGPAMAAAWSRTSGGPSTGGVTAVGRAVNAMTTPRSTSGEVSARGTPPSRLRGVPGETRASRARGGEARSPRGQPREGCRMRRSLTQRQRRLRRPAPGGVSLQLAFGAQAELGQGAGDVGLRRASADAEQTPDLSRAVAEADESGDLPLPAGEGPDLGAGGRRERGVERLHGPAHAGSGEGLGGEAAAVGDEDGDATGLGDDDVKLAVVVHVTDRDRARPCAGQMRSWFELTRARPIQDQQPT